MKIKEMALGSSIPKPIRTAALLGSSCTGTPASHPNLAIHIIESIQADADFYPEPEKFKPERFLRQTQEAYLPFALGPRNCIVINFALLEMKILITKIVKQFQI